MKDRPGEYISAEVVGFKDKKIILMPFENVDGVGPGCIVENTGERLCVKVGPGLLGKTVDGLGEPIDGSVSVFLPEAAWAKARLWECLPAIRKPT